VVTDPQTYKQTHKQMHKQTGPITIHCAAKLSAQCNEWLLVSYMPGWVNEYILSTYYRSFRRRIFPANTCTSTDDKTRTKRKETRNKNSQRAPAKTWQNTSINLGCCRTNRASFSGLLRHLIKKRIGPVLSVLWSQTEPARELPSQI